MPFPWNFRRQTPFKDDRAALTELLTLKNNTSNAFHGNEWMKEHNILLCFTKRRYTFSSAKENAKYMFCYLDFHNYFEANGQNDIHFRLIQVLKNSMAWQFLTFTSPSSKLKFVYPPCCGVEEKKLIFSSILTPGRVKGAWTEIQSSS